QFLLLSGLVERKGCASPLSALELAGPRRGRDRGMDAQQLRQRRAVLERPLVGPPADGPQRPSRLAGSLRPWPARGGRLALGPAADRSRRDHRIGKTGRTRSG